MKMAKLSFSRQRDQKSKRNRRRIRSPCVIYIERMSGFDWILLRGAPLSVAVLGYLLFGFHGAILHFVTSWFSEKRGRCGGGRTMSRDREHEEGKTRNNIEPQTESKQRKSAPPHARDFELSFLGAACLRAPWYSLKSPRFTAQAGLVRARRKRAFGESLRDYKCSGRAGPWWVEAAFQERNVWRINCEKL